MAERRYSKEDQKKMLKDTMENLNARGAQFKDAWVTHPDGTVGLVKELKREPGFMVDQSQEQTEQNKETTRNLSKSNKESRD